MIVGADCGLVVAGAGVGLVGAVDGWGTDGVGAAAGAEGTGAGAVGCAGSAGGKSVGTAGLSDTAGSSVVRPGIVGRPWSSSGAATNRAV